MAVPIFSEFFRPFLEACSDGQMHRAKDVRDYIAAVMKLSAEDQSEMLSSNRQSRFGNRVNWARTYLDRAGLIETPVRAQYRITEEGHKALNSGEEIDVAYLERYQSFREFQGPTSASGSRKGKAPEIEKKEITPVEELDNAFKRVNASLAIDLLDEVMKLSPEDFEHLVVKLLLKMGYGSGIEEAGKVTPLSGDSGIDGTIKEDQLGFSTIYIQAKKWDPKSTVSTPEIQKFAGALMGKPAAKGLFVTTAKFSAGARKYAESSHTTPIVLVDGEALMQLMIKNNLGVSVDQVYEVKKIDSDFFNDSL